MNNYKNPLKENPFKPTQEQPQERTNHNFKNNEDFTVYYQKNFSCNKYIERILHKIAIVKGLNDSTCIRNLIYEEYQKMKKEGIIQ